MLFRRSLATLHHLSEISNPINCLPISLQAIAVVPLPIKQSSTMSFGCVACSKCLLTSGSGLMVGCSKVSLSRLFIAEEYHFDLSSYPSLSGTPFSLKESYAKDSLFILPKADKREDVILQLKKQNREVLKRENRLLLPLHGTLEAVAILQQLQGQIEGFEVMQGTLDDVFLNVTGKNLLDVEA